MHDGVRRRRCAADRQLSHAELDDTPIVDAGFFVLMGNDDYLFRLIDAGEGAAARDYAAWLLGAAGGYAIKVVNPGGIELWKQGRRGRVELDTPVGSSRVTRVRFSKRWSAPPISCACRMPRTFTATISASPATSRRRSTACGRWTARAHFTHLQFHSYGVDPEGRWRSGAREIAEYINAHPNITGDVGQVLFGAATTLTADGPVEYLLHKSSGRKWVNVDIELETGCGIVPYAYKKRRPSPRCNGRSASSCSCCRRIRGASCCPRTIRTADRSWRTRS